MHTFALSDDRPIWQYGAAITRNIRIDWRLGGKACHVGFDIDGGEGAELVVYLAVPLLFSLYVSVPWFRRLTPDGYALRTSLRVFDYGIWLDIFNDDSWSPSHVPWRGKKPGFMYAGTKYKWSQNHFYPLDFILGRQKYSDEVICTERTRIPMPEGNYDATVTLRRSMWKRPRWPIAKVVRRATIKPDEPIPVPGKGTTEYNVGPDAIHELTTPANSVSDAVAAIVRSALDSRERYPL